MLGLLSVWALAIGFSRYRHVDVADWNKWVELEADLTEGLTTIATVAANSPGWCCLHCHQHLQ